ncbi:hypothetical protein V6N13_118632 [Hibiscus sabdariffa]
MKKSLCIVWPYSLYTFNLHRSFFSPQIQLKSYSFVVSTVWISLIERQHCFSYGFGLKSSSRWRRTAKKWSFYISYHWFSADLLDVHGFSQNHASDILWRFHPWQRVRGEASIRFGSVIKGFMLTFHCKRQDMWSWLCSLADVEDVGGRVKQSLDFVYAYYPVSLTNGPRHSAQPDVFISKADTFNQNGWISEILGVSSFPLPDFREQASPCFVQSREIFAGSFKICYKLVFKSKFLLANSQLSPIGANNEKLKREASKVTTNVWLISRSWIFLTVWFRVSMLR